MKHENRLEKFWSKVNKTESCWFWTGSKNRDGYGLFGWTDADSKGVLAHRFSAKHIGNMTIDQMLVCHTCDTPACVNPKHLFIGTQGDNMKDKMIKGRAIGPSVAVKTPLGIFSSLTEAGQAHNCSKQAIGGRIKRLPTEYKRI